MAMRTPGESGRPVKTAVTAFSILEYLKDADGGTLTELTDEFDLVKSTLHRHLKTLHELEYVTKEGDIYYPSLRFLDFGEYTRNRKDGYTLAKEKVRQLAEATDERAQFLVEEHGMGVYVYRDTGSHAVRTDPGIGKRIHLHSISAGKAILAYLPPRQVEQILSDRGLPAVTEYTTTDREELVAELETIRERGYSFNKQENIEGLHAVGAPVLGPQGHVIGALSVSGPIHRMKGEWYDQELPDLLRGMANELELNIEHS